MTKSHAFFVALTIFFSVSLSRSSAQEILPVPADRIAKARGAEQALLDLQFFHKAKGMILPPGFPPVKAESPVTKGTLTLAAQILNAQLGVIVDHGQVIGYHQIPYEGHRVGVIGCAMCHVGKAAGRVIPGLGNKNIDVSHLADIANQLMPAWYSIVSAEQILHPNDKVEGQLRENSQHFLANLSNKKLANHTQGLVPIGLIRQWFFQVANQPLNDLTPGQVKVPSLWGYGEKRKVGSFSDGFGNGLKPGWAIAVELVAGQTPEGVREYLPKLNGAEDVLADLLPPAYPFRIDAALAEKGEVLFNDTCSRCHGTYTRDIGGLPIFEKPKFVPYAKILTDDGRLRGVTPHFRELVRTSPLNDLIEQTDLGPGYMAPRLLGIWARFPYLHNGSVPTVFDLLTPQEKRPALFSLREAGELVRFDMTKLGLAVDPKFHDEELTHQAQRGARWVYDTRLSEHSNQGHSFDSIEALSDDDRYALIEYLKTL